jgi:hypothetical protein
VLYATSTEDHINRIVPPRHGHRVGQQRAVPRRANLRWLDQISAYRATSTLGQALTVTPNVTA